MSRPAVLTLDDRGTRREVFETLLRHLTPAVRVDFLDWCCAVAKLVHPAGHLAPLAFARADRPKMAEMVLAAVKGDETADRMLANEVYADVAGWLCHQWGLDYLTCCVELESWAKGREPTPPAEAARRLLTGAVSGRAGPGGPRTIGSTGSGRPRC